MAIAQDNGAATDADDRTKPPFLRRVRIQGYKSIAFCDVALQPLTILVGRNAAGKSNFLDALAFLRDLLALGTDEAVRLHGGRKAILNRSVQGTTVSFSVEAGFQSVLAGPKQEGILTDCLADYSVEIGFSGRLPLRSKPEVLSERVRIKNTRSGDDIGFDREHDRVEWIGLPEGASSFLFGGFGLDHLTLSLCGQPPFLDLSAGLQEAGFYNFSPEAIREPQIPTPGTQLARNGRNLASVIESVREIDESVISRIEAYLSAIVGEVNGIKVVYSGDYEMLRFMLQSSPHGKPLEFDASSMSDGTLRVLAALVAVFQIQLPSGPSVVGIEEPETSLHPAAMRALVDALDEATGRTQVLLTTHSADLLDDRDLHPYQILVVRNRDGQTLITPIDPASREIIDKELYTLADLQRQDQLDLDEADLQRQVAELTGNGGA